MTLHLVELPIDLRELHRWAGSRDFGGGNFDEGKALHHLLGETFGPAALQPFRLMVSPRGRTGTVYAYSDHDSHSLRDVASATATPGQQAAMGLDQLRSIPRPPSSWKAGQRLGFDLRVLPLVRLHSELSGATEAGVPLTFRKGAEVDAFLARVLRGEGTTRERVYLEWLSRRLAPAATLDVPATRMASFRRQRVTRKGRRLEVPDITIHGTLAICDPAAFARLLAKGVGRHRAYGYGMLLLRPPQKAPPDRGGIDAARSARS